MNTTINGHHLDVTPALREYVLTKLEPVLRHFNQVVRITVLLTGSGKNGRRGSVQKAQVTLHVKGEDIHVEQSDKVLYTAIDRLMDRLDRAVQKRKDKLQDVHLPAVISANPAHAQ